LVGITLGKSRLTGTYPQPFVKGRHKYAFELSLVEVGYGGRLHCIFEAASFRGIHVAKGQIEDKSVSATDRMISDEHRKWGFYLGFICPLSLPTTSSYFAPDSIELLQEAAYCKA
jgi:hypothetical protein